MCNAILLPIREKVRFHKPIRSSLHKQSCTINDKFPVTRAEQDLKCHQIPEDHEIREPRVVKSRLYVDEMQELNKSYNHITFQHLVNIKTNNHSIGQILTQNQSVMKLSFKLRLGYAMKMYNSMSLCSHLLMLAFLFGTSLPEQGSEYKQCTQSVSLMS